MNPRAIFRNLVTTLLLFSLASCSCFVSHRQAVTITSNDPNAQILIDGQHAGQGTVVKKLRRNRDHMVNARVGDRQGYASIDYSLSTTGVLDIVGGFLFLFPFIGLLTPGAFSLEETNVNVYVP